MEEVDANTVVKKTEDMTVQEQADYYRQIALRYIDAHNTAWRLDRENSELSKRISELEDQIEETRDYLRLVREERDTYRFRAEAKH